MRKIQLTLLEIAFCCFLLFAASVPSSANPTPMKTNNGSSTETREFRVTKNSNVSTSFNSAPYEGIMSNGSGGGLWSASTTWIGGVVPGIGDDVLILNGDQIVIDVNAMANNLIVGNGASGSLTFDVITARTLTVASDVTINNGASITTSATGTHSGHVFSIGGNLINNGTLNLSTNNNMAGANLTFIGGSNNTFGGTGATNIMSMTINKGTAATNILELNPSNFKVKNVTTDVSGFLTLTNGTLKISGTFPLTNRIFTSPSYIIPATGGIWLNNPNVTISGQAGSVTLYGTLRLSAGTYNIGIASGNSVLLAANSTTTVEGGTLNVAGRYGVSAATTIINYSQSGGDVTINRLGYSSSTLACFDLGTSILSSINITGGTITIQLANGWNSSALSYRNQAGTGIAGVTGGTLFLGNANSGAAKNFVVVGILPNVEVTNTSAAHTAAFSTSLVNYNNISLNVKINAGNTFNFGNATYLFNGNSIINNGTLTHNEASSRFITYQTETNISYSGTGTVTAPITSLELQNDLNFTFEPGVNPITVTRIVIFSGSFVNANHLIIGNGGATSAMIQIGNNPTPTGGGTFDVAPAFNIGTGGQNITLLKTTNPIVFGHLVNPDRILKNLTVDGNTTSATLTGGSLHVAGTLALTSGHLNLSGSTLTLGSSPTSTGTLTVGSGRTANGLFKRWIGTATGSNAFPIGTLADAKTASINYTTAPATGGTLTAEWVSGNAGTNGLPLNEGAITVSNISNEGFWRMTAADGLNGGTYTGTFTAGNTSRITDHTQLVLLKRTDNQSPWILNGTHIPTTGNTTTPILSRSGMSGFSDFGIGSSSVNVLPVSLINFSAFKTGNIHRIEWQTSSEQNNQGFEIQRSADGKNFTTFTSVSSKAADGNSLLKLDYSVDDEAPLEGNNYYRLKQTDKDGRSVYSRIILLKGTATDGLVISKIYPIPAVNNLNVVISASTPEKLELTITDINGKTLQNSRSANVVSGENLLTIDVAHLKKGTYFIVVKNKKNNKTSHKFIKQ